MWETGKQEKCKGLFFGKKNKIVEGQLTCFNDTLGIVTPTKPSKLKKIHGATHLRGLINNF